MDNTEKYISLCAGYGGLELGMHRVSPNLEPVAYVEREAFACANLVAKIEAGFLAPAPIWTDVKTFPARQFRGKVHGIIGGYPCQPFSSAGKRRGAADDRHLWPFIRDHIEAIQPVWCFFENVAGHLTMGFDAVCKSLWALGYAVEAGLYSAAEVGAPHKRERLFILAHTASGGRCERISPGERARTANEKPPARAGESSYGELAHTERLGRRGWNNGEPTRQGRTLQTSGSSNLAHSENNGTLREPKTIQQADGRQGRWPARPGQPQHEWEEPRTVKSGICRTVDGFASRVDELRLLGNGVVPATAALAWRTLWVKMLENFK